MEKVFTRLEILNLSPHKSKPRKRATFPTTFTKFFKINIYIIKF